MPLVGGRVVFLGVVGGSSCPCWMRPSRQVVFVPGSFAGETQVLSFPLDGME